MVGNIVDEVEGLVISGYIFFAYDENHLIKNVQKDIRGITYTKNTRYNNSWNCISS